MTRVVSNGTTSKISISLLFIYNKNRFPSIRIRQVTNIHRKRVSIHYDLIVHHLLRFVNLQANEIIPAYFEQGVIIVEKQQNHRQHIIPPTAPQQQNQLVQHQKRMQRKQSAQTGRRILKDRLEQKKQISK